MLIPNHPEEERLSALASNDTDAIDDRSLTDHVDACVRCTELVTELGALRAELAELPDLAPSRPLQLVPAVEGDASSPDRVGGWARRLFAPFLFAGATLAFVGLVGTALPAFSGMASSGAAPLSDGALSAPSAAAAEGGGGEAAPSEEFTRGQGDGASAPAAEPGSSPDYGFFGADDGAGTSALSADVERSIWPMVLFAGVALIIAALLMRWILAPRAG